MKLYRLFFAVIALITANHAVCMDVAVEAIDRSRIVSVTVKCLAFDDSTKDITFGVMDITKPNVEQIFATLLETRFPIYTASCFAPRNVRGGSFISMHAYGTAIDINYLMNPYFNVHNFSIIPGREQDRIEDEISIRKGLVSIGISTPEIETIINTVTQPEGSDDWFLNRGIHRKGMVTPEVVATFKQNGFDGWGGMWRQPMDYMHFQTPRVLAEQLAKETDLNKREILWDTHLEICR